MTLLSRLAAWCRARRRAYGDLPGVEWPGPVPASPPVSQLTDGPKVYYGDPEACPPVVEPARCASSARQWKPARFEWDRQVNALDIHLAQGIPYGPVARTVHMLYAMVLVDLDDHGRVLGLELLDALPPDADIATAEPDATRPDGETLTP